MNLKNIAPLCKKLSTAADAYPRYHPHVGKDSEPDRRLENGYSNSDRGYGANWDQQNAFDTGSWRNASDRHGQSSDRHIEGNGQILSGNEVGAYRQEWNGYEWSNAKEQSQNLREQAANRLTDGKNRGDGVHLSNDNVANVTNYHASRNNEILSSFGPYPLASSNNYVPSNFGKNHQQMNNINYASSNFGQHQQANNSNYASSFGQHQQADNFNNAQSNFRQHQPEDNTDYAHSTGAYQHTATQQNGNVGWTTSNHYQNQGSNVAGYQQNPYGNLIYKRNDVTGQSAQYPSAGYSNTGESLTDALETSHIKGTIEELVQYSKEGKLKEALEVLELLEKNQQCLVPERDMSTMIMLMEACGEVKEAKIVHKALVKLMNPLTVTAYNKILDMYMKCGSTEDAYSLFNEIPNADVSSWDTMIRGFVKNDLGEEAIDIFTEFKNTELKPDGRMFLGVFSACGIVGDVSEGMLHFHSMSKQYGIMPSMEHYVGVVEMFGNAGYLDNALEFVENMMLKPSVDVWETLMHVSRIQGNMELGDRCAELVEKLDPSRLSEQSKAGLIPLKTSDLEKDKEKKKLASKSLLEVRSRVHEYRAGDTSHPENDRIYALLRGLKTQMKEAGYIPELRGVLHDIDPEGKEEALLAHSERLAAAYGFLTTAARQPIRVIKNLRVCVDCHNALKIISKLVGRELIMRDAKRFHHFKDGVCSCKDYW